MWILVAIVVLVALFVAVAYNGLVRRRNRSDEAWAQIDVQLRRRYDLIPNLVETVKGYAAHEQAPSKPSPRRAPTPSARRVWRSRPMPRPRSPEL